MNPAPPGAEGLHALPRPGFIGGDGLDIPAGPWTLRRGTPTMKAAARKKNLVVGVGDGGTVFVSQDARNWSIGNVGRPIELRAITVHAGRFIAGGTGEFLYSSEDGATWQTLQLQGAYGVYGLCSFKGKLIVGLSSPSRIAVWDGAAWTTSESPAAKKSFWQMTCDDRRVLVAGTGGVARSDDGLSWEPAGKLPEGIVRRVSSGPSGYLARLSFSETLLFSQDGDVWEDMGKGLAKGPVVAWIGNAWATGGAAGELSFSADGKVWESPATRVPFEPRDVLPLEQGFLAIGAGTSVSEDARNWSPMESLDPIYFDGVAFGAGRFVAVGNNGAFASPDGKAWTRTLRTEHHLFAVASSDTGFVAVGPRNQLYVSTDGTTWMSRTLPKDKIHLNTVVFGNGRWVAAGDDGVVATSTDADSWNLPEPIGAFDIENLAFHRGKFIGVSNRNGKHFVFDSSDGQTWNVRQPPAPTLLSIASNGAQLFAAGLDEVILVSEDGVDWQTRAAPTVDWPVQQVFRGFLGEVAFMGRGASLSSRDGVNWSLEWTGWGWDINDVVQGNGIRVAVGGAVFTRPVP